MNERNGINSRIPANVREVQIFPLFGVIENNPYWRHTANRPARKEKKRGKKGKQLHRLK
jgi:hypothetical protein